jgi:hypothetical protein
MVVDIPSTERDTMAQRIQTILEDDLDGGPADETVTVAYNGITYELDLSKKNVEKLVKTLAPYTSAGRKLGSSRNSLKSTKSGASGNKQDLAAIRAWARANGHKVSDRGRVSQEVQNAYRSAH